MVIVDTCRTADGSGGMCGVDANEYAPCEDAQVVYRKCDAIRCPNGLIVIIRVRGGSAARSRSYGACQIK